MIRAILLQRVRRGLGVPVKRHYLTLSLSSHRLGIAVYQDICIEQTHQRLAQANVLKH